MDRSIFATLVLALATLSLAQDAQPDARPDGERAAARPGFPEPVEVMGVRVALASVGLRMDVQGPPAQAGGGGAASITRSISATGTVTPLAGEAGESGQPENDRSLSPTAVLGAEITRLVGDDCEMVVTSTPAPQRAGGVLRERQQLSRALLNNPHLLLSPPPHVAPEQLAAMRRVVGGFSAHARLEALPGRIDRMEVSLDLVHAAEMSIVTLPLEAMGEHKEIAPGVRLLVREVREVEQGGRAYTRVAIEYFIDRVHAEEDGDEGGEGGFEATPLVPAIGIRDAQGRVVHIAQHVQETETRDQFIVSLGDLNLSADSAKAGPLTLDVVVLHGLQRRRLELAIEDLALAGD